MTGVVWLNGALLPEAKARIDPADRGFLLADGVFETLRVADGGIWHLPRHLARLRAGAAVLGLPLPFPDAEILTGMRGVLARCGWQPGSLRLTLTAGPGPRGLLRPPDVRVTVLITAAPAAPEPPPAALIVSAATRRNQHSPLSRIKALGYGDQLLARREAAQRGADDAILLNGAGALAGASAANLLLHNGVSWLTPPVADGALPGITRGLLIEAGLLREQTLWPADLATATQLLLVNALGMRPVKRLDDRPFQPLPSLIAPLVAAARDPDIAPTPF